MKFELMIQVNTLTPVQFEAWVEDQEFCTLEHGMGEVKNNEFMAYIIPHSDDAEGFGAAVTDLMKRSVEGL